MGEIEQEDAANFSYLLTGFHFDERNHAYFHDGEQVPGFTEIATATGFIKENAFWTDEGRDKGKRLAKSCSQVSLKTFDWAYVDQDIADEILAYEKWLEETGFVCLLSEAPLYSRLHRYAGTLDLFGKFPDGSHAVIDLKRGAAGKATALQTAAYVQLVCESFPKLGLYPFQITRYALRGFSTGRPKMEPYTDRNDLPVWLGLVRAFHWGCNAGIFTLN